MKKIILSFRQFITALRVLKNLPTMQSDLYKVMNTTAKNELSISEHSRDIDSISHTIVEIESETEDLDNRVSDNYREIENTQYNLDDKIDRHDVIDIVEDERDYVDKDDIYEYTLSESDIRELVHEEMLEFTPESVETAHNLSDEEYQNIVRDVIREIVQRLEM